MPCRTRMKRLMQGLLWLILLEFGLLTGMALEPGFLDFDNLPDTNFTCVGKVIGGYYADLETNCQMFHVCTIGQLDEPMDIRFLCLNGTVFDQETRVCERIDEVDCTKSEQFYSLNLELYGNTQPPILEEDASVDAKSTTSTTTTTTTPRPPPPTYAQHYTTAASPTTTTRSPTKVITSHHFPVVNNPDIRFNPQEININLNPGAPPHITRTQVPISYQQQIYNDKHTRVTVTTHTSIYKHDKPHRVPLLSTHRPTLHEEKTTQKPKSVVSYGLTHYHNQNVQQPATPTEINYGFTYQHTEESVDYHTEVPPHPYQYQLNIANLRPPTAQGRPFHQPYQSTTSKRSHKFNFPEPTTYRNRPSYSSLRSQDFHSQRTEKPPRLQLPLPLLPTLSPLTFSSPAPFSLGHHVETKRYTSDHHSPPRIIISASASVSDNSGRRLNYSLGTIGAGHFLGQSPASYDDYKEADVSLDPFYHDVPKIKSLRHKRDALRVEDIIKNDEEADDLLKFLFQWYSQREKKKKKIAGPIVAEDITEINKQLAPVALESDEENVSATEENSSEQPNFNNRRTAPRNNNRGGMRFQLATPRSTTEENVIFPPSSIKDTKIQPSNQTEQTVSNLQLLYALSSVEEDSIDTLKLQKLPNGKAMKNDSTVNSDLQLLYALTSMKDMDDSVDPILDPHVDMSQNLEKVSSVNLEEQSRNLGDNLTATQENEDIFTSQENNNFGYVNLAYDEADNRTNTVIDNEILPTESSFSNLEETFPRRDLKVDWKGSSKTDHTEEDPKFKNLNPSPTTNLNDYDDLEELQENNFHHQPRFEEHLQAKEVGLNHSSIIQDDYNDYYRLEDYTDEEQEDSHVSSTTTEYFEADKQTTMEEMSSVPSTTPSDMEDISTIENGFEDFQERVSSTTPSKGKILRTEEYSSTTENGSAEDFEGQEESLDIFSTTPIPDLHQKELKNIQDNMTTTENSSTTTTIYDQYEDYLNKEEALLSRQINETQAQDDYIEDEEPTKVENATKDAEVEKLNETLILKKEKHEEQGKTILINSNSNRRMFEENDTTIPDYVDDNYEPLTYQTEKPILEEINLTMLDDEFNFTTPLFTTQTVEMTTLPSTTVEATTPEDFTTFIIESVLDLSTPEDTLTSTASATDSSSEPTTTIGRLPWRQRNQGRRIEEARHRFLPKNRKRVKEKIVKDNENNDSKKELVVDRNININNNTAKLNHTEDGSVRAGSSTIPTELETNSVTDAPLWKSANPTKAKYARIVFTTTPLSKLVRLELRRDSHGRGFAFNCFHKQIHKFYSDPRDCRLFHYCTLGYTRNQMVDMKFVCDSGTYFDDEKFVCTKAKPSRCL